MKSVCVCVCVLFSFFSRRRFVHLFLMKRIGNKSFSPKRSSKEKIHIIYINTRTRARTSEKGSWGFVQHFFGFFLRLFLFLLLLLGARAWERERERKRSKIGGFALIIECNTYKHR